MSNSSSIDRIANYEGNVTTDGNYDATAEGKAFFGFRVDAQANITALTYADGTDALTDHFKGGSATSVPSETLKTCIQNQSFGAIESNGGRITCLID